MNPTGRVMTPWESRKRKLATTPTVAPFFGATSSVVESTSNNRLLAGYMAHEFLTRGTLMGQKWDPARAEAMPVSADSKRAKLSQAAGAEAEPRSYGEVAMLLKSDGAHIPGVVNPAQLGRWIQM